MAQEQNQPTTASQEQGQASGQGQQMSREQPSQQQVMARRASGLPALGFDGPFSFMRRLSEEMDQLFSAIFGDFGMSPRGGRSLGLSSAQWVPPIEVFERDHQLVVRAELPGLNKDDVKVEILDNMLTIAGERQEEHEENREGSRHSERRYGRFERRIALPEGIKAEEAQASFQNGMLEVTLPAPAREERGRQIEIQEGSSRGTQSSDEQSQKAA